ncbi:MAG TPA: hypothetical protein DDZ91_07150, partial [Firmicutes bacterium]|nr:hypothetical protein [Bacillota bacterium]
MNELTVIERNGQFVVDSREVAGMVDRNHKELLRDIRNYEDILTGAKLRSLDFFISDTYRDAKNESRPCYLITRKGCDMVANKMTGEKGVLFTAAYVTRFEEMEKQLQPQSIEDLIIMQAQSMKQLKAEVAAHSEQIQTIKETLIEIDEDWRRD